jgi:hypothetical protein
MTSRARAKDCLNGNDANSSNRFWRHELSSRNPQDMFFGLQAEGHSARGAIRIIRVIAVQAVRGRWRSETLFFLKRIKKT